MAVSHPDSPDYGKHWTLEQVVDTFAPTEETIRKVFDWLQGSGFSSERIKISGNKGWIQVDATVAEVEELLDAEYHVYKHSETGEEQISEEYFVLQGVIMLMFLLGCDTYSVPAHIRDHVDLIKPTVHFNHRPSPKSVNKFKRAGDLGRPSPITGPKKSPTSNPVSLGSVPPALADCDEMITLDCLKALYSVPDFTPKSKKNTFGIVEFTPQGERIFDQVGTTYI